MHARRRADDRVGRAGLEAEGTADAGRLVDPRQRARMNQWISAVNGYYYPYLIYHVSYRPD